MSVRKRQIDFDRGFIFSSRMMKSIILLFIVHLNVLYGQQMDFWLTDPDKSILFEEQTPLVPTSNVFIEKDSIIEVNSSENNIKRSMDLVLL